ncbi:hypothetical protein GIB67_022209 [Kingdonia uniflora]|uniref:Uncharacterized protein n=1 Tax=Kingdonia uniflora TaxID=39325 RepID=A0A7J7M6U0_9MAGN|nr:hypothetical protein GIB67_022209 [Kingdonia uniflora]
MNESNNEGEVGLEQFPGFPGQLVSYPPGSDAFREFCKANAAVGGKWGNCAEFTASRTWYDNIIWVKGNCLQKDDKEPLDLRFGSVKQSKCESTVERKESLLDKVAEEETELELVLEGLSLSRKRRVDSRSNKVRKAQSTSLSQPNPVKPSKVAQKYTKKWMLKALPASSTTGSGEVAKDKRRRVEPSGKSGEKVTKGRSASADDLKEVGERTRLAVLQGEEDTNKMVARLVKGIWLGLEVEKSELKKVETKANLDEMVKKRDRLGHHLMLKGFFEEEVDAIKANTYVEEEDEGVANVVGVTDGLDGVSRQTVLANQWDDVELPEGGSDKAVREMSLKINDLESGLARERKTSKVLLSAQAELLVELDSSRSREDNVLMCNREFAEQFDRMKEANGNREDQYVKTHFRLVKLTQAVFDLTLQVEEKDSEIKK